MESSNRTSSEISFLGTADCGPTHGPKEGFPIERYTELVRPTLASVDLRFGNCERQYSSRKAGVGLAAHACQPPAMAKIFSDCGFDAMTIANNHMYSFGPDPLLDTRALLQSKGIQVTGAGKDLEEACKPAIVERNGIKVGFLGYCSVLPEGGVAGPNKVGIAPLRIKTYYDLRGPHSPPRVHTEPDERDLEMITDNIGSLRSQVDVVMLAFHWGVDWVPRVVADYQVRVARACIDAGADLIMGHHPHVPKAIEVYKGKAVFYCMGALCMTSPLGPMAEWREPAWAHGVIRNYTDLDPDYPLMPYGKDSTKSILVKAILLRALAITSAQPSTLFPTLPTIADSGLPGYQSILITGIFAPAKTPATLIKRLNQEIVRVLNRPDVKERFLNTGVEVAATSPAQFAAAIKSDMARMGKVIKDNGIRLE